MPANHEIDLNENVFQFQELVLYYDAEYLGSDEKKSALILMSGLRSTACPIVRSLANSKRTSWLLISLMEFRLS